MEKNNFTNVYKNNETVQGSWLESRCIMLALKAMVHNCPDDRIVSASFVKPGSFASGFISSISWCIDNIRCDDKEFMAGIRKKRDHHRKMMKELSFDEYHWVSIGIKDKKDNGSTVYCLMAIDKDLKEVIITKGIDERMKFLYGLGPKYESALRLGNELYNEISNKKAK
jgi:hypothetical protein